MLNPFNLALPPETYVTVTFTENEVEYAYKFRSGHPYELKDMAVRTQKNAYELSEKPFHAVEGHVPMAIQEPLSDATILSALFVEDTLHPTEDKEAFNWRFFYYLGITLPHVNDKLVTAVEILVANHTKKILRR